MRVYQHNGCMYCHTQQVRSEKFGDWWDANGEHKTGADIKRSYGLRRTVSRDYIYDNPTMLGTMRTGPDLANIGVQPVRTLAPHAPVKPAIRELVEHHAVVRVPLRTRKDRRQSQ